MQEIAKQFEEEYTELLSRYKEDLTNAQIMSILQSVTRKQIGIKDNPERFRGRGYAPGFPIIDELKRIKPEPLKWDTPRTEADIKKEWIESEKLRKKLEGVWVVADKEPY